ncbi:MAG: hypothetical protein AAB416_01960 [Patescibacteria group bacterium]
MFDLLEEDLLVQKTTVTPPVPLTTNPLAEPVVIVMPEKFRHTPKKSVAIPLVIAGGAALLLASIGGVAFLLFGSKQQPDIIAPDELSASQGGASSTAPIPLPPFTGSESSTASVLDSQVPSSTEPELSSTTPESTTVSQPVSEPTLQAISSTPDVTATSQQPSGAGPDSDTDHLTDAEERMYGTDPEKPDSDEDGFLDGTEVSGGFDPTKGASAKLASSSLVNAYANKTFGYSFTYPSSWLATSANQSDREVLASSATGEFISFSIHDNPDSLSPLAWATTVAASQSGEAGPFTGTLLGGSEAATSKSGLVVFLSRVSTPGSASPILEIKYNLNTKNEINFQTTFSMILKSLKFIDVPKEE